MHDKLTPPMPSSAIPWQRLLDDVPDGVLIELGAKVAYVNPAYAHLLGYRGPSDLTNRPIAELLTSEDALRLVDYGRMRTQGQRVPSTYDFAALCRDGSIRRLHASVSLTMVRGLPYITTIARPFPKSEQSLEQLPMNGPHEGLSPMEVKIMDKLLAGKRPKEIALEMEISDKTVATHRSRLLHKLGIVDNRELFQYALRYGLINWT